MMMISCTLALSIEIRPHHHVVDDDDELGSHTLGNPSIRHETLAWRMESCITWWYMFPSARRKFEPESKLILTFWYFEDVISKWRKSLKYCIPLTRIRPPQSRSHLILTFWSTSNRLLIEAEVSWSTVYYTSDFSEIWICHLFWSPRKHFFWISESGKHI